MRLLLAKGIDITRHTYRSFAALSQYADYFSALYTKARQDTMMITFFGYATGRADSLPLGFTIFQSTT